MNTSKKFVDSLIDKARVHLYKPIQIAEILYRDRINRDISLSELETYRTRSKSWRDVVCIKFLGRTSTSSAKYQDDIFSETAMPPRVIAMLGEENRAKNGIVEAYIYRRFFSRFSQMSSGLEYTVLNSKETFHLKEFLDLFWNEPGLRRSIDKIYEIVVYSLFSALVDALEVKVRVSISPAKNELFEEFKDFANQVISIDSLGEEIFLAGKINRVGVTNAADRGLDMWANFGLAIQIKHLSLTKELAENIVGSVSADRIVIVCKDAEEQLILSILGQMGWRGRIQSIITESQLIQWYEKALRGKFSDSVGNLVITNINNEIGAEFPATNTKEFLEFFEGRGYHLLGDDVWKVDE